MKFRSTLATVSMAALTLAALTACASTPAESPAASEPAASGSTDAGTSDLAFVNDGQLTVCSDMPYEPFEMVDESGKAVGFDIDIVQAVADDLGVELNVIDSSFDAITSGVFKAQCDIAASSISITDERKGNMDFSDPYYDDDLVLVAPVGSDVSDIASAAGKKVGVQTATTGEAYGQENGLDTIGYEDSGLQIQSMISGQTDATLGNQSVLRYAIAGNDDFEVVEEISTGEQLGVAVGKGNTPMVDAVNATLERLSSSGELEELETKWFDNK